MGQRERVRGRAGDAPPVGVGAQAGAPVPAGRATEASLALMVVIWGVNFAIAKWALAAFEPLAFNALRFVLASAFVFVVLRTRGQVRLPRRQDVPRVLLLGLLGNAVYQVAFIVGLDLTRAGNASLMLSLVPVFVLLMGLGGAERHGARAWVGAAASAVGVALVSWSSATGEGGGSLMGDLILLGAAVLWAFYTVGGKPLIERYGSLQTTAWTLWVGAVGVFLIGLPSLLRQPWGAVSGAAWGGLLYSALLSIGLAYLIWYRAVERLGGARTAIFSNLTPVVALLSGALLLGERLGLLSMAGAGLVLGGVWLVRD